MSPDPSAHPCGAAPPWAANAHAISPAPAATVTSPVPRVAGPLADAPAQPPSTDDSKGTTACIATAPSVQTSRPAGLGIRFTSRASHDGVTLAQCPLRGESGWLAAMLRLPDAHAGTLGVAITTARPPRLPIRCIVRALPIGAASIPNEPYARVNASRGWSLPVIRPEPRLASCAGVTPATGPRDPLWAHLSDHANEVSCSSWQSSSRLCSPRPEKLTSLTPSSLAACCCSPGPGRWFLIGGRHNRYADGISSSAAGRRRPAPSPAASPARSARASGSPRSRRVARPAPNWAKKPWRALPDRHARQIPRLAASDPRDPRRGLRDVRPSCT